MKKAMLYAKEFQTSKVILTFSMYLFRFFVGQKKFHSLCMQFAAELIRLLITIAAAFCFCEQALIILANKK